MFKTRGSSCGRKSRGQRFAAVVTAAMELAANSGNGKDRQGGKNRCSGEGRQQSNKKRQQVWCKPGWPTK